MGGLRLFREKIFLTLRVAFRKLMRTYYQSTAAEMSFHMIISVIPLMTLIMQFFGFIGLKDVFYDSLFMHYLDAELISPMMSGAKESLGGNVSLIFIFIALWSSSKIVFIMTRVANYSYYLESRRTWNLWTRFRAVFLVIFFILLLAGTLVLFVYGRQLFISVYSTLDNSVDVENVGDGVVATVIRWFLALLFYWLILAFMYKALPEKKIPLAYTIPGSLLAATGIILTTGAYSFYLKNFSHLNLIYGSLGAVVALLFWFLFVSVVLMLGVIVNAAWLEVDQLYRSGGKIMLSRTVKNIVPSGTVAINARVFEMKAEGIDIINLSVGEPDFNTPDTAKDGGKRAMDENKTRYDKVPGLMELREEICRKLREENHVEYTPDQIVVSNGAKQCITNTCFALLDPDDEVLIPAPYWVSYPEIVKIAGGKPVFVETKRENDFKLTGEDIEKYSNDRTKMVILCNPSNPLGTVHTRAELEAIAEVCVRKKIYIMSDEVYETICFADEFVSMADISPESKEYTILLNGLSKSIPMTGWRIGYTATTVEIAKAITAFQGHITSHPSMISQWAGVDALKYGKDYTAMMVGAYRERMEAAVEFLHKEVPEVSFIEPKGAFYLFIDISCTEKALKASADDEGKMPQSGTDSYSTEFTMKLLNEKHVAIAPGAAFGMEGFVRVAYATDKDTLLAGLELIRDLVKELV